MRWRRGRSGGEPALQSDLTVRIYTDLHVDFVGGGPMAASGADAVAEALVRSVAEDRAVDGAHERAVVARRQAAVLERRPIVVVGVEGLAPWQHGPRRSEGRPPHALQRDSEGLLPGIAPAPDCPWVWTDCPSAGGDPLDLGWDAKGRFLPLGSYLSAIRPGLVEIVGLSLEHGGLPLAEALVGDPDHRDPGRRVVVLAGRSTFLDADGARSRLDALAAAGVDVDWTGP